MKWCWLGGLQQAAQQQNLTRYYCLCRALINQSINAITINRPINLSTSFDTSMYEDLARPQGFWRHGGRGAARRAGWWEPERGKTLSMVVTRRTVSIDEYLCQINVSTRTGSLTHRRSPPPPPPHPSLTNASFGSWWQSYSKKKKKKSGSDKQTQKEKTQTNKSILRVNNISVLAESTGLGFLRPVVCGTWQHVTYKEIITYCCTTTAVMISRFWEREG